MKNKLPDFDEKVCALSGECGEEIITGIATYLKNNLKDPNSVRGLIFCLMGSLYAVVNSAYSYRDLKDKDIRSIRERINHDLDKIIKENQ